MTKARDLASGLGVESGEVIPHIKPDVLYPAVAGKDLSGIDIDTSHGSTYTYGTTHADGKMYYYTDIKGSKPIKDPRIGAYFGSQRYHFRSLQLLKQETAANGINTYTLDGREWCKAQGTHWVINNNTHGNFLENSSSSVTTDSQFIEVVGYFNDANVLHWASGTSEDQFGIAINGGTRQANDLAVSAASPLNSRYEDAYTVRNVTFNATPTLGINTLRISNTNGAYYSNYGVELIAQDISSTANKSKIQIPAQTVISYGKKHSISATSEHYDPFNGFVNDTTLFSAKVDTATSLGLGTATTWGCAWDKGSSNHIRPLNGGRVVKWIDSSGNIKTSVTMMPRNAQNIGNNTTNGSAGTASNEITTASATNAHTINFSDDVIDNSLSEVANTFHYREFGNGSANGNSSSYQDFSTVAGSSDHIAFALGDGCTTMSARSCNDTTANFDCLRWANGSNDDQWLFTFIGTGISWEGTANMASNDRRNHIYAQNLPYGTHVVKVQRTGASAGDIVIDGITVDQPASGADDSKLGVGWITIYQPKMPPVPEDACIISDYFLMADFVAKSANGIDKISKGTRLVPMNRDHNHDYSNGSIAYYQSMDVQNTRGFLMNYQNFTSEQGPELTYFGDAKAVTNYYDNSDATTKIIHHFDGATTNVTVSSQYTDSGAEVTSIPNSSGTGAFYIYASKSTGTMGVQKVKALGDELGGSTDDHIYYTFMEVSTPVVSASHYVPFETPFIKELCWNTMEQTHLICSPTGQTWDEVTRDTSYIGNACVSATTDTNESSDSAIMKMDEWRGVDNTKNYYNKDYAIAYDRVICLVDGHYEIHVQTISQGAGVNGQHGGIKINGTLALASHTGQSNLTSAPSDLNIFLKRGDYVQVTGKWYGGSSQIFDIFQIKRIN